MNSALNKLSEYIYFYISRKLLHTLLLFVFKIAESRQCIFKTTFVMKGYKIVMIDDKVSTKLNSEKRY